MSAERSSWPAGVAHLDALVRLRFDAFVEKAFYTVNPGSVFQPNWHNDAICHVLTELVAGRRQRQIISMPPRSLKSIITSVALPAWLLGCDPGQKIVCISYSDELALAHARDFRAVVRSAWYRRAFPAMQIARDTAQELTTTRRGGRFTTSVRGTLTGRGGNLIILDDPMKPDDAASKTRREGINEWIRTTVFSRLNDKRHDKILLVMQRVHIDDPVGIQLRTGDWHHLNLPAIAETAEIIPLGRGNKYCRAPGEPLHPEREPLHVLERLKAELGTPAFSAQYQQAPVPPEGGLIKRRWLRSYDAVPNERPTIVQSWDTATTTGGLSDYSVCTEWHVVQGVFYLRNVIREKLEFPDLRRRIIAERERARPYVVLVEDEGAGKSLIQSLRREGVPIIGISHKGIGKEARLQAQSAKIEGGIVLFPRQAPWLHEFIEELVGFPSLAHDDQVDAMTQALAYWDGRPTEARVGKW